MFLAWRRPHVSPYLAPIPALVTTNEDEWYALYEQYPYSYDYAYYRRVISSVNPLYHVFLHRGARPEAGFSTEALQAIYNAKPTLLRTTTSLALVTTDVLMPDVGGYAKFAATFDTRALFVAPLLRRYTPDLPKPSDARIYFKPDQYLHWADCPDEA